jgi:hypothetical protein
MDVCAATTFVAAENDRRKIAKMVEGKVCRGLNMMPLGKIASEIGPDFSPDILGARKNGL